MTSKPSFYRYLRPAPDGAWPPQTDPLPLAEGKGPYFPEEGLQRAVCTALAVGQPLLVTGEPGCGKSTLAWSVAAELGLDNKAKELKRPAVARYHTRSDSKGRDVLYHFDGLRRLYDAQVQDERAKELENYVKMVALGEAIKDARDHRLQRVVLIDEIDKAPPDLPNDLLDPLDRMEFQVEETNAMISAPRDLRPVVIITSNQERQLPAPFLRRCVYYHIKFPSSAALAHILAKHCAEADENLRRVALARFLKVREELQSAEGNPPSLGELITWVQALAAEGLTVLPDSGPLPSLAALVKRNEDQEALGKRKDGGAAAR